MSEEEDCTPSEEPGERLLAAQGEWDTYSEEEKAVVAMQWLADRKVFVVLGAQKSGTTALRSHLWTTSWLDNISLPQHEPHFFDDEEEYALGPVQYASWFWNRGNPDIIGDVTPSYMYIPIAVPRLQQMVPHARLVVMLRNPIDRALSQQNHDLAKGREVGLLRDRVKAELDNLPSPSRADIFRRGLYCEQLERVLEHFPKEQLHVVISERYRANPHEGLQQIRTFCGLQSCTDSWTARLPEIHVRTYQEFLSKEDREFLGELYAEDVAKLKLLLDDPLEEWVEFA